VNMLVNLRVAEIFLGNSRVAERLLASQEGLSSMDQGTGEDIRRDN
jgi:hypothetical protein